MRDDLTGFAIGGNKVRKLDYLIGDATKRNSDALVTTKATNFSRNAAAAGRINGMDVHVVCPGDEAAQNKASRALFHLYGTHLHFTGDSDTDLLQRKYEEVVLELRDSGKSVYELHPGGSDQIGALGYLDAFGHIVQYSRDSGIHFDKIVHSTGSTGTQVGLLMGQCLGDYDTTIIGMAASQKSEIQIERVRCLAVSTAELLGIDFDESTIKVDDRFIGPGYAIQSEAGKAAAEMFVTLEGVLLDDVYTGKAAAGLIDYAEHGLIDSTENVLFIHTGGNSGMFY